VRILAVALADEAQRFTKGLPAKGARLFVEPNIEVMRLAALLEPEDEIRCVDERVENAEQPGPECLCLVHVGFNHEDRARDIARTWDAAGCAPVFFGPQVTAWNNNPPDWCRHRVLGDITGVWHRVRLDAARRELAAEYRSSGEPSYVVPRALKAGPDVNTSLPSIHFARGCFCPEPVRPFCPEHLYYGTAQFQRDPEEIVGELISLHNERIRLLDDDVTAFPDFYFGVFRRVWNYRRQWIVNASDRIFELPRLVRLLAKAGTRIVYLNESFLLGRLDRALSDQKMVRWLYRRVKSLQAAKMLVGARIVLPAQSDEPAPYERIASVLRQIDLDFIEVRFTTPDGRLARVAYRPMLGMSEPAWIKHRFYAMDAINDRLIRRPRRVGFYNTVMYALPYSLSYRQNFLERLPWP
jgi:hypothetical protein